MFSTSRSKELIGKAIDLDEPLPEWLADETNGDPKLAEFYDASLKLAEELRLGAAPWIQMHDSSGTGDSIPVQPSISSDTSGTGGRKRLLMLASAATVLLAMGGVLGLAYYRTGNGNPVGSSTSPSLPRENSIPPTTKDASFASVDSSENSFPMADFAPADFQPASEDQFKKYFFVTIESSIRTLQSVGGTLSEKAVCSPLQSAIRAHESSSGQIVSDGSPEPSLDSGTTPEALRESQIQLISELLQTTDFLVETLPAEVTRSWVELSVASNASL